MIDLKQLEEHRMVLVERGRAMKILLDVADPERVTRSEGLKVLSLVENKETGALHARVQGTQEYQVVLEGPYRERIRVMSCTCQDFDRNRRVCKHIAAVGQEYLQRKRAEFRILKDLEQVLVAR